MGDRPFCLCLAGPNGSGKSTLGRVLKQVVNKDLWIDPDEVAEDIRTSRHASEITPEISRDAFHQSRNLRVYFAVNGQDFGFETVFSHGSNVAFLRAIKAGGYEVHLYYVCTEAADINIARVHERIALGGHAVSDDKIRQRYARSLQLLSLVIRDIDRVVLLDNSQAPLISGGVMAGGRVACDIQCDNDGNRRETILSYPPIPNWALRFGLFPFSRLWQISAMCKDAVKLFGDEVNFKPPEQGQNRIGFFNQFKFP